MGLFSRSPFPFLASRRGIAIAAAIVLCAVAGAFVTLRSTGASHPSAKPGHTLSALAQPYKQDSTTLQDCNASAPTSRTECRKQALANIAYAKGADAAFATLRQAYLADTAGWAGDAHIVQHGIGSGELARLHGDVGAAIAAGARTSTTPGTGGYLHGILLVALAEAPRDQLAAKAASFCGTQQVRHDTGLTYWCLHGMGHALMIYSGNDLPWALKSCDKLGNANDDFGCYIGAFMENYGEFMPMMQKTGVHSQYVSQTDLLYPCNSVDHRYRRACYIQLMIRVTPVIGGDFRRIPDICRTVEHEFQPTCYNSAGTFSYDVGRGDPGTMASLCSQLLEGAGPCTQSAVQALMGNRDPSGHAAAKLCGAASTDLQAACYGMVGRYMASHGRAAQLAQCKAIVPAAYYAACASPGSGAQAQPVATTVRG